MFSRITTSVALTLMLSGTSLFAQDPDVQAQQRAQQQAQKAWEDAQRAAAEAEGRRIQEERAKAADARGRGNMTPKLNEFTSAQEAAAAYRERVRADQFNKFRVAFSGFQTASAELSEALAAKISVREPARKMEKSTGDFLDFVKLVIATRPRFDSSPFKDFTPKELGWETLTSSERIVPALERVIRSEDSSTVDIGFMMSFTDLQKELLRLQWMTHQLR